jgi:transcriptional regulator with XRE-family HTH domain
VDSSATSIHHEKMDKQADFGKRVRELREAKLWSQEDFADASNLHRTYISGIERGTRNPTLIVIWQIADALKVHPCELFTKQEKQ